MSFFLNNYSDLGVVAEISSIESHTKVKEFQVIMHVADLTTGFNHQLKSIHSALKILLSDEKLAGAKPVFSQCFLSDAANQHKNASDLLPQLIDCPICYVKQPPLDGSKLAIWIQLQTDVIKGDDGLAYFEHNGYRQYYTSGDFGSRKELRTSSYEQTMELLEVYEEQLIKRDCTIERNCIRTWFFVRDVDVNYKGVVDARKENFIQHGLNNTTHYIASTGIEGCTSNPQVKVMLNTYTIRGLENEQIQFLYAKDYLSPTYDYGVTFERGVRVKFGDRSKVLISGTASIDNKGAIVYPFDVEKQVQRTWVNVSALLKEAECTFDDLVQIIVYLRDIADYQLVNRMYNDKFPNVPKLIVLAPVCRPGWLIEMECIASKQEQNTHFRDF
jgi:enamine deaminase RidA (YjgF/YER057c/UK114 family)